MFVVALTLLFVTVTLWTVWWWSCAPRGISPSGDPSSCLIFRAEFAVLADPSVALASRPGGVAERLNAPVLKTIALEIGPF